MTTHKPTLTAERLKELFHYDPSTGVFTRLTKPNNYVNIGDVAGGTDDTGRRHILINFVRYKASRLAWLYMTGEWPVWLIDHIDGNPGNDSWHNLRLADKSMNGANRKLSASNKAGLKGVSKDGGRWRAQIRVRNKKIYLGTHATPEAAHEVYKAAAIKYFGEFSRFS